MSRIGKQIIEIPEKVNVSFKDGVVTAKGSKAQYELAIPAGINFSVEGNTISLSRDNESKALKSVHGLTRSLLYNTIHGLDQGFSKVLKIEGVGFRAEMKGNRLVLSLGYSHPILVIPPDGIEFVVQNQTTFEVKGIDKQLVGEVASKIKKLRPPEPYKGKGVRYEGEYIRRKAGKTSAK